jgi:hypothetical protein
LRAVAAATQGTYQLLGPLGEGLGKVRRLVESSIQAPDYSKIRKLGVDRFHVVVAVVTGLLVIESLIGTRRKLRENRVGG